MRKCKVLLVHVAIFENTRKSMKRFELVGLLDCVHSVIRSEKDVIFLLYENSMYVIEFLKLQGPYCFSSGRKKISAIDNNWKQIFFTLIFLVRVSRPLIGPK